MARHYPVLRCKMIQSGLILVSLMLLAQMQTVWAAPKAELWTRWAEHDQNSQQVIDHAVWEQWLGTYVKPMSDGINRVDYGQVSEADRTMLKNYIAALAGTAISRYNRDQQQAFWINLYNALTVDVILENYPLKSIREIRSGIFSSGPWGLELVTVESEALTLDDIEHRILRPIWRDSRIHYAVNCASLGCPNLQPTAFTADNTDQLLERGAREFVNHPRAAEVSNGELKVSSIYEWFGQDFGGTDQSVIAHLKHYANDELKAALDRVKTIGDDTYDWTLNGVN